MLLTMGRARGDHQALAVLHPDQVRRLVLCASYPGTERRCGAFLFQNQTAFVALLKAFLG
jgi:pimeloyl-ACP methyl ester carboxylesterase